SVAPEMQSDLRIALTQLGDRTNEQIHAESLGHGAVIHEVECPIGCLGRIAFSSRSEDPWVWDVHGDEGLVRRQPPRNERVALRMVDANHLVRDKGTHTLLETERPVYQAAGRKLRGEGLWHRIMNVEDDLPSHEAREQTSEHKEIGQIVDVEDVDFVLQNQRQARERGVDE